MKTEKRRAKAGQMRTFLKGHELANKLAKACDALSIMVRFSTFGKLRNLLGCYVQYLRGKEELSYYPFLATTDPVNQCNLHCPHCATGSGKLVASPGVLSLSDFSKVIDLCGKDLYLVSLFLSGEPFLNKDLLGMVGYAFKKNVPALVHSNLSFAMQKSLAEEIVTSGLRYLSVSIDGVTQEVYGAYRVGGDLRLVQSNIDLINDAKKRLRSRTPYLTWQFLLFKHNEHEVRQAAAHAKKMHMRFRIVAPDCPGADRSLLPSPAHPFVRPGKCKFLWTTVHCNTRLKLLACCQLCADKYILGDLAEGQLRQAWNNASYRTLRRVSLGKGLPQESGSSQICRSCQKNSLWELLYT